ncbi:Acg family FMN-binding oxidoreductase [Hamadaea tsunoensis]|uniref:Acg family FMN-binding oxidoreductase n=1 Tax=Hamadaea tsunoensis TaxID=53368 RepID=UPI0004001103|nr:nitroreductase [Hamadaea tsunoensis]
MQTSRPPAAVLAEAAAAAGFAPSVHNTQPWRWRVHGDVLDLYADRSRQLTVTDPDGRLMVISCGTAVHHATVALAAEGVSATVATLPDPAQPDLLARIAIAGTLPVTAEAMRTFQDLQLRHTDRRPVHETAPPAAVTAVRAAITALGVDAHLLRPDQVAELGAAAEHADRTEMLDPAYRTELAYWIGGQRAAAGVPSSVIPSHDPAGMVPGRDFVRRGTLAASVEGDGPATYLMLFGDGDEPADWLRAGQALSAGWLAATACGLSVLPFSSVIEVVSIRELLRRDVLSGLGCPYLVVRLGVPAQQEHTPPRTPRLAADQIVEIA